MSPIRRKATVSSPGDPYEHEADEAAAVVMRMAEPAPSGLGPASIQRKCAACDEENDGGETTQTNLVPSASAAAALDAGTALRAAGHGGEPLPRAARDFFEPRFRRDFSRVRVHAGDEATRAARAVQARAYTVGQHIVFGHGEYEPGTSAGRRLLAHELAHTLQGDGSRGTGSLVHRQADPEAARVAKLIADYDDAVRRFDWEAAAEHLNAFNDPDVQTRLGRLSGTELAEMRRGAAMNPRLGGGTRLVQAIDARNPDAPRVAQLIDNYEGARHRGDWRLAAEHLNGFNDTDIPIRLGQLTDVDLAALRGGAAGNPRIGGGARLVHAADVESTRRAVTAAAANPAAARAYLNAFQALSPADQEARIALMPSGFDARATLGALFQALPAAELDGVYRDTIRRISDLLERRVARERTGQTDAQMAQVQATFMDQEAAAAAAAAAAAVGGPPPTAAQVQQAHQQSVNAAGIGTRTTNRWTAIGPAPPGPDSPAQAAFRARATTAIAGIVARAATQAPELGITAAQISFRPDLIDCAPDTRYAEVGSAGGLNVGMDFIDAAMPPNGNPDYVLGVVVHEIYGHPAYGNDMTQSYTFQIFNQARPLATQALSPAARAAPATRADMFAYGYHGTEIYSEMREHRYTIAAPAGSGVVQGDVPADDILNHVHLIKTQFAPSLAIAFLRGMYARFRIDPRITPAALGLFTSAVEQEFPGQSVLQ